jgi:CBS domain-containing membrane protein
MDDKERDEAQSAQARYAIDREHPIGGEMSEVLRGLLVRVQLPWLLRRHANVPVLAAFAFLNGLISIAIMSAIAVLTSSPFIFP